MKQVTKSYDWLDVEEFERAKKAITVLFDIMAKNGGKWRKEWINDFSKQHFDEIRKECFEEVCNELGFEKTERGVIGVAGYFGYSDDESLIARVEVTKRLKPIEKTFKEIHSPQGFPTLGGWLALSRNAGKLIEVKDGKPYIPDDLDERLKAICTLSVPEEWRELCDLLRDNEKVFVKYGELSDKHQFHFRWWKVFENGKFELKNFILR
ncbi:MAG: hypothetical protein II683_07970 [Muribaculaceae bacterium]|nr:hypothetical protein [Muribaculaceae bacterium]